MPGKTLWLWDTLPSKGIVAEDQDWRKDGDAVENVNRLHLANYPKSTFSEIRSGCRPPFTVQHGLELLGLLLELAEPAANVEVVQVVSEKEKFHTSDRLKSNLKLAGFANVQGPEVLDLSSQSETVLDIRKHLGILETDHFQVVKFSCQKPDFEIGSSRPLSFANKILEKKDTKKSDKKTVWSLDDVDDEEVDFLDEDDLIDEEDLKKPDSSSLRVCGTTGKRKACKDCSCGLAEELADGKEPAKKTVESSCGSCYLGDAFRCASCPYLGMPAFKPGEKIQLSERQLKPDK